MIGLADIQWIDLDLWALPLQKVYCSCCCLLYFSNCIFNYIFQMYFSSAFLNFHWTVGRMDFVIEESLFQLLLFVVFPRVFLNCICPLYFSKVFFICIPQLSLDCGGRMDFVMEESLPQLPLFNSSSRSHLAFLSQETTPPCDRNTKREIMLVCTKAPYRVAALE